MGLLDLLTWWKGPGLGTRIFTSQRGIEAGRDGEGNVYYSAPARGGVPEKRWVIYNGTPEASRVPPEWHLWLHKTVDTTPAERPLRPRVWEKPWQPNLTGTTRAHAPSGSLLATGTRAKATGDYEAWTPE